MEHDKMSEIIKCNRTKEERIKEYYDILSKAQIKRDWLAVAYVIDHLDWELKTRNGLLKND
jgi:hypothetical protein